MLNSPAHRAYIKARAQEREARSKAYRKAREARHNAYRKGRDARYSALAKASRARAGIKPIWQRAVMALSVAVLSCAFILTAV